MRLRFAGGKPLVLVSAAVVALSLAPAVAQASMSGRASAAADDSAACTAAQLSLSVPGSIAGDPMDGMGNLAWNILLRNSGTTTCSLTGWAAIQVRRPNGKPAAIKTADVTFGNLGPIAVRPVLLGPGQQAVVTVDTTDNTRGCAAGWKLRLTLPGVAGSVTATQPADFFGPCGGGKLNLSPFYSRAGLASAISALRVSASPPVYRQAGVSKPAACSPSLMSASVIAGSAGAGSSVQVLRLASRGSAPCVLPGQWPTVLLHEVTGASQVAKALMTSLPAGARLSALGAYGQDDDVTLRPGVPTSIALVTLTTGTDCRKATSAAIYPAAFTAGPATTITFTKPVTFCGLPRVLPFLAGQPTERALSTVARGLANVGATPDGDGPKGFWYGSDSNYPVPTSSSGGVYLMPYSPTGGSYGGYVGEIGNYANWQGCTDSGLNWNQTDYNDAQSNVLSHNVGVGAGVYWMMAGAGREPSYSSTNATRAMNWGTEQAERVISDFQESIWFPYVFMDIENAWNNGWNEAFTGPCGDSEVAGSVPPSIDRDTFNGFWDEIAYHSVYYPAVYCAGGGGGSSWYDIFLGQTLGNTSEWTYVNETSSLSTFPTKWSVNGTDPVWFASAPAKCELLWQWSGGDGITNPVGGDFDQIDANNNKACE
jgi:hypothetical protein